MVKIHTCRFQRGIYRKHNNRGVYLVQCLHNSSFEVKCSGCKNNMVIDDNNPHKIYCTNTICERMYNGRPYAFICDIKTQFDEKLGILN